MKLRNPLESKAKQSKAKQSKAKQSKAMLLYEDYVWVSLGNAMKAKQSKSKANKGTGTQAGREGRFQLVFALLCFYLIST